MTRPDKITLTIVMGCLAAAITTPTKWLLPFLAAAALTAAGLQTYQWRTRGRTPTDVPTVPRRPVRLHPAAVQQMGPPDLAYPSAEATFLTGGHHGRFLPLPRLRL